MSDTAMQTPAATAPALGAPRARPRKDIDVGAKSHRRRTKTPAPGEVPGEAPMTATELTRAVEALDARDAELAREEAAAADGIARAEAAARDALVRGDRHASRARDRGERTLGVLEQRRKLLAGARRDLARERARLDEALTAAKGREARAAQTAAERAVVDGVAQLDRALRAAWETTLAPLVAHVGALSVAAREATAAADTALGRYRDGGLPPTQDGVARAWRARPGLNDVILALAAYTAGRPMDFGTALQWAAMQGAASKGATASASAAGSARRTSDAFR